jgi:hypothetical protein
MKIYLLHIFLLLSIFVTAQKFKEIKSNPDYIWGEATNKYLDKADIAALNMLVSQISSRIKSNFTYAIVESGSDLKEYSELVINTYSDIYLQNTKRLIEKKKNKYTVLRFIDRTSLNKMFENRRDKILDYARLGILAEKDLRIGDAIRYYYWSISLLKSHPDFNTIKIRLDANNEFTLITFLQNKLNEIFNNININIVDAIINKDQTTYMLEFKYSGQKVQNLDYTYWIGNSFSNLYSVKDGLGAVEYFHGQAKDLSKIQLKIEFFYSDRSNLDPEVKAILETPAAVKIKQAEKSIDIKNFNDSVSGSISTKIQNVDPNNEMIFSAISNINQCIINKDFDLVNQYFSETGAKYFNKLIQYGNATLLSNNTSPQVIRVGSYTMVRSFPMLFCFSNGKKKFVEDIIYIFDENGKIVNVNFGLNESTINSILNKSEQFADIDEKYFLINLLETYKTAYSVENLYFIKKFFSDDALIIVGTALKYKETIDYMYKNLETQNVRYTKFTKAEYLRHLERVFNTNEYINLQFEECTIKRSSRNNKIFGIQLAQNYYSTNYSDKGYLFLMIDLNDLNNPVIYVRTWQPEKNPDGSIIGLENFSIN